MGTAWPGFANGLILENLNLAGFRIAWKIWFKNLCTVVNGLRLILWQGVGLLLAFAAFALLCLWRLGKLFVLRARWSNCNGFFRRL